ncbi:MAG: ribonuclease P protein component [Deltaproteobacteria bacterium]|nr:ribonuclease P protein component [Deltaproteobacteria bacterium]
MKGPGGLTRAERLSSEKDIGKVFRHGRYFRLGLLQAKTLPRQEQENSRFLISVRKSAGSAPARNRIKRVVREAIRQNRDMLVRPYDVCLFVTGKPKLPVLLSSVEPEIQRLFARLSGGRDGSPNDG